MTVVLLNTTPIVDKLVERMTQKRGDTLYANTSKDGRLADVVIVDDSVAGRYSAAAAKKLGRYALFIGSRFEAMPAGFDAQLAKPFLPDELDKALEDAELALSAAVERSDMFDADEAASSWEAQDAGVRERPVFDRSEIDELKQLLEAVESDEGSDEMTQQLDEALRLLGAHERERSEEEVLYDADAAEPDEPEDAFEGIDLHARGVEALQDLMAILSDESVAQAFKAIGVRVDISFGEKA